MQLLQKRLRWGKIIRYRYLTYTYITIGLNPLVKRLIKEQRLFLLSARKVKTILREQDVKEEMMPLEKLWPFLSHKRKHMVKFFAPTIPKVKEFILPLLKKISAQKFFSLVLVIEANNYL